MSTDLKKSVNLRGMSRKLTCLGAINAPELNLEVSASNFFSIFNYRKDSYKYFYLLKNKPIIMNSVR